jgi:hypothetical protein
MQHTISSQCPLACRRHKQLTLADVATTEKSNRADEAIALCFYGLNIPFNTIRTPLFKRMLRAVASAGAGYAPPSYDRLRCDKPAEGNKPAGLLRVVRFRVYDQGTFVKMSAHLS